MQSRRKTSPLHGTGGIAGTGCDQVLHELQLYGYRPFNDEPDLRPLPEANILAGCISDIFDALVVALADTRLEPDLEDLLWSTANVFHRAIDRIERELDDNELAQQRSQREQDGSEVKSVEPERLTAEGQTLIERRNAFELMRDQAAEQFEHHTHSAWRPRNGSKVNHRNLPSAMIDRPRGSASRSGSSAARERCLLGDTTLLVLPAIGMARSSDRVAQPSSSMATCAI